MGMDIPKWDDGRPKNFAIVTYAKLKGVEAAMKLDKSVRGSCTVDVNPEISFRKKAKPIIVKGLPDSVEVLALRKHFANCGVIKRFFVTPPNAETKKKLAVITYTHQKEAD